jgi:endogenous inhibitor of DNA gyrase (YacG/DUF329 family)
MKKEYSCPQCLGIINTKESTFYSNQDAKRPRYYCCKHCLLITMQNYMNRTYKKVQWNSKEHEEDLMTIAENKGYKKYR